MFAAKDLRFTTPKPLYSGARYNNSALSAHQAGVTSGTPITMSFTALQGAAVVVGIYNGITGAGPANSATASVTFGGQALSSKGYVYANNNTSGQVWQWIWALNNQTGSGAQTLSVTLTESTNFSGYISVASYTNVTGFGSLQTATGSSTSPSLAATATASTDVLWGSVLTGNTIGITSFDLTQRQIASGTVPAFVMGDTTGVTSKTVTATLASSTPWCVAALDIQ